MDSCTPHGDRCECLILAAAVHGSPDAIPYSYCRSVLQKRYAMHCRHGEVGCTAGPPSPAVKWQDFGDLDAVQAILLKNA